jgi:hypothetical protein
MKKILLPTALVILVSITLTAQWRVMNPHPTPNTSYIGSAPSENRFITVTGQGEAIVTHDGGQNWEIVQIGGDGITEAVILLMII